MKGPSRVDDLMDKAFFTFSPDTSVSDAVSILERKKLFGACVVDDNGQFMGIFSEAACLDLYGKAISNQISKEELDQKKVRDVMYAEFKTVSSALGLMETAQVFLDVVYRRLPVLDQGRLVGQITQRDIVKGIESYVK
jgi:CBS domain-containing protein